MSDRSFEVKPVTSYEGARYPAAPAADDKVAEERTHPIVLLVSLVLLVGITVGLVGCYMRSDYIPETPGIDGGPDGDPPEPDGDVPEPLCDEGEARCLDTATAQTCEDGAWVTEDCYATCEPDELGRYASWAYCDESVGECVCNYDIEEGIEASCMPEDVWCADTETLITCPDYYEVYQNCNEYCAETYGPQSESYGCDATVTDNPCQCYDMLDGDVATCTPGDVECWGSNTAAVCNESYYFDSYDCGTYCVSTYGADYVSLGCDATLEEPCNCAAPDSGSGK
jgi:hypothetical protein